MMKSVLVLTSFFILTSGDEVILANNLFSSDVYKQLSSAKLQENFIASPFSLENVLALTLSGAKGETAVEVRNALHLEENSEKVETGFKSLLPAIKDSDKYSLDSANKIYVKSGFSLNEGFKKIAEDVYQSGVEAIDFVPNPEKAAETMNKWVEEKTKNKIKNLIDSSDLDGDSRLVLINALYFRGKWSSEFGDTYKRNFSKSNETVVELNFMRKTSYFNYHESSEIDAKFLEIPFEGQGASLIVILPNEKHGLRALEDHTEKIFTKPKFSSEYVNVHLPKFKIESEIKLNDVLKNLGVIQAFKDKADLSGIAGEQGDLYVSKILQKSFVDLDQRGIDAAAATQATFIVPISGTGILFRGPLPKPKDFEADHPFIFYIQVKGVILFVGRVIEPKQ